MTGSVWSHVAVSVVSFMVGAVIKIGYIRLKGRKVYVPFVDRSAVAFTGMVLLMSTLSLVTIFQVQQNTDQAEDCNRQFRTALLYNADINSETRVLDDREDAQLDRRRAALDRLVDDLSLSSDPSIESAESQMRSNMALQSYKTVVADVGGQLAEIKRERDAASDRRAPYPQPRCGEDS